MGKKQMALIILLINFLAKAQCPAPSNVTYYGNITDCTLSWTENGTASSWEIAILPNYVIGTPLPTSGFIQANTNPFTITGLSPGCNVFFIRSVCSSIEVSSWAVVASLNCSTNVYIYLDTLSTNSLSLNQDNHIEIVPNPATHQIQVEATLQIDKITIIDSLGKVILTEMRNVTELYIGDFPKGIYLIQVSTRNGTIYKKIVKE
ncbi:MAG: T9SS type A sorting domain-containing protein [Flavobacterium sp.]|nr:MAG: T9SS type A sorting domain-containing protein [Flavobacterium sp.]